MMMFVWFCVMTQAFVPSAERVHTTAYVEHVMTPHENRANERKLRLIVEQRTASRIARGRAPATRSI